MTNYTLTKNYDYIFIDWHGVLSDKGFWYESVNSNLNLSDFLKWYFKDLSQYELWMRNYQTIDSASDLSLTYDLKKEDLKQFFENDMSFYQPNTIFLDFIQKTFPNSKKYIITDNIDLFELIYQSYKPVLSKYFISYFSSHQFGKLKTDEDSLYLEVLKKLNLNDFTNCLTVDDNLNNCQKFQKLKGNYICLH